MLNDLSSHSNDLEILFWDLIFHLVKALHKLQILTTPPFHSLNRLLSRFLSIDHHRSTLGQNHMDFKRRLLVLIILFNTGMIIGLLLGYIHSL